MPCRESLINVLLLIDASVPTQNIDLGCAQWLYEHQVPFSLVFTKIDKQKKKTPSPEQNIANFEVSFPILLNLQSIKLILYYSENRGKPL